MAIRIDKARAAHLVRRAAVASGELDGQWVEKVEKLSSLCDEGVSKTHIAFLGTAILAKAMNHHVDLFALKPKHAVGNANAYSARTLCHSVLVPLAAELGFHIGVTGREPLNNQPYFRMRKLDDGTPVHAGGRAAFDYMLKLVSELQAMQTESEAEKALQAYLVVRRKVLPTFADHQSEILISPEHLTRAIETLLAAGSEKGRRAQAVTAGLFDAFAGPDRVECGRINDPSRKYPGDVCVRSIDSIGALEKAVEVRDKPVTATDVRIFGIKCIQMGVREAAIVMVAPGQEHLNLDGSLAAWASCFGLGLTLFHSWVELVDQVLFWASPPKPQNVANAVRCVKKRLIEAEVSPEAVALWVQLTETPEEQT